MPMHPHMHATATGVVTKPASCLPDTGFLRQGQVLTFVPISKSTLWRQVRARSFPSPVKLSERVTAWRVEDVRLWITERGTRRTAGLVTEAVGANGETTGACAACK